MGRHAGVFGAGTFQQARGVHFKPRGQKVFECAICGRVSASIRKFVVADITLVDGSARDGVVACKRRRPCLRRVDKGHLGRVVRQFRTSNPHLFD